MALQKWYPDLNELYDYVTKRVEEGATARLAIDEYSKLSNIPESKVRIEYYKLKGNKEDGGNPRKDNTLSKFSEIIDLGEQSGLNIVSVLDSLLPLFKAAVHQDNSRRIQELDKDLSSYKTKYAKLEKELDEMKKHVSSLNGYLDEFLNMPALKKIGHLEDFTYNLKVMVDKTGLVHSVEKV